MSWSYRLGELPQTIAIVRSLPGLGDLLCAVPAWRALRTALPHAQITLIGLPWAQSFVERSHYLDNWLKFPGFPGIPEGWHSPHCLPEFLIKVHKQPFDLAIQMHGSGIISNPFTVLLGAKTTAGFYLPGQYCPDPNRFLPYPEAEPEVRRHLRLMEFLGIPLQGEELEFPLLESDWLALKQIPAPRTDYVCIHPGASVSDRRWLPEQFARVADALSGWGYTVVLTGTVAESQIAQTVTEAMHSPVVNLVGRTSLGALAALLKGASLLVCNDTGVSHLAAALGVKSVVIFSNSDPQRWAPLDRQRHRVIQSTNSGEAAIAQAKALLQEEAYAD